MESINSSPFIPKVNEFKPVEFALSLVKKILGIVARALAAVGDTFQSLGRSLNKGDSAAFSVHSSKATNSDSNTQNPTFSADSATSSLNKAQKVESQESNLSLNSIHNQKLEISNSRKNEIYFQINSLAGFFDLLKEYDVRISAKKSQLEKNEKFLITNFALLEQSFEKGETRIEETSKKMFIPEKEQAKENVKLISEEINMIENKKHMFFSNYFQNKISLNIEIEDCDFVWSSYAKDFKEIISDKNFKLIKFSDASLIAIDNLKKRAIDEKINKQVLCFQALSQVIPQIPMDIKQYIFGFDNDLVNKEELEFMKV